MGLVGILCGLVLLVWLAFRGWSVLLLAPAAALLAAAFAREPLLANWTQTFMGSAAGFLAQFFPLFLLGALFGKLMEDSGAVSAIANFMIQRLGQRRALLAVVLAGALVTYGGVSLFVAFFVLAPMAEALFRSAAIPRRLMPAAIALGTSTFTMSALPGTPAIQNAIPMPFFGTTPFAAPGLGIIASAIMLGFGLWWLSRAEASARRTGEGFGGQTPVNVATVADDPVVRERASTASEFDPAEIRHGHQSDTSPPIVLAMLPLAVVISINLLMSLFVLPRLDVSFLAEERWGGTSLAAVGGVWAVVTALAAAIATLIAVNPASSGAARERGCRCECLGIARLERRKPGGFRRGRGGTARLCRRARLGASDRGRSAGVIGRRHQRAGGSHRVSLGRPHDSARCARRHIYAACSREGYRPSADAPRRRDRLRHARQLAA